MPETSPEQQIQKLRTEVERLRALISTDELTGLLNRRGIFMRLEPMVREVNFQIQNKAHRRKIEINSLVVVMADIDKFKDINDRYGHTTGDLVLKAMGKQLKNRVRTIDVLGRLGGEEFLIGFLGADLAIAVRLADDLRKIIESAKFMSDQGERIPVTASFGVSQLQRGESLQDVIDRADAALYEAKEKGRNRVVAAKLAPKS